MSDSIKSRTDDGGRECARLDGGVEGVFAGVGGRNLELAALCNGSTGVEALDMFSWLWDPGASAQSSP